MKVNYIYYSLYQFYTKIIKVQRHFPPIVNIAAVLAFIQMAIIFTIVNLIIYYYLGEKKLNYHPLVPFGVAALLYWLNERHFGKQEQSILKQIDSHTFKIKLMYYILTIVLISFVIWSYLFDGIYEFLQFYVK